MNTERIHTHHDTVKRLGNWTTAGSFEVRSRNGYTVLDLRSPQLPGGDIEVRVDLDRSALKLLLPDDARVDHWDLAWTGRGKVKDMPVKDTPVAGEGGRTVRITGEVRHGEIRVRRGGVALLTAMFSRAYLDDVRRVHREGGVPTVDDPARTA